MLQRTKTCCVTRRAPYSVGARTHRCVKRPIYEADRTPPHPIFYHVKKWWNIHPLSLIVTCPAVGELRLFHIHFVWSFTIPADGIKDLMMRQICIWPIATFSVARYVNAPRLVWHVTEEVAFDCYPNIFLRVLKSVKRLFLCFSLLSPTPAAKPMQNPQNSTIFYVWQDECSHVPQASLCHKPQWV